MAAIAVSTLQVPLAWLNRWEVVQILLTAIPAGRTETWRLVCPYDVHSPTTSFGIEVDRGGAKFSCMISGESC